MWNVSKPFQTCGVVNLFAADMKMSCRHFFSWQAQYFVRVMVSKLNFRGRRGNREVAMNGGGECRCDIGIASIATEAKEILSHVIFNSSITIACDGINKQGDSRDGGVQALEQKGN